MSRTEFLSEGEITVGDFLTNNQRDCERLKLGSGAYCHFASFSFLFFSCCFFFLKPTAQESLKMFINTWHD